MSVPAPHVTHSLRLGTWFGDICQGVPELRGGLEKVALICCQEVQVAWSEMISLPLQAVTWHISLPVPLPLVVGLIIPLTFQGWPELLPRHSELQSQ